MVSDDWIIKAETTAIRVRSYLKSLFRILGLGLILLAAYNALISPSYGTTLIAPYRITGEIVITEGGIVYLDDVAVFVVGAIIAWIV